jgi:hypothetical protein
MSTLSQLFVLVRSGGETGFFIPRKPRRMPIFDILMGRARYPSCNKLTGLLAASFVDEGNR